MALLCSSTFAQEDDTLHQEDGNQSGWLALPFASYAPETNLALGVGGLYHFFIGDPIQNKKSKIMGSAVYTLNGQFRFIFTPQLYFESDDYFIRFRLETAKYPWKFFGIGNDRTSEDEELYTAQFTQVRLEVLRQWMPKFYAGLRLDYERKSIFGAEDGGLLDNGSVVAYDGGYKVGIGLSLRRDTRNRGFSPSSGEYIQSNIVFYEKVWGSNENFNYYMIDFRKYFTDYFDNVIAVQFYCRMVNGNPPFDEYSEMGGDARMRGYHEGKQRDKVYLHSQIEYRKHLFWRIGGVVFAGIGDVQPEFSAFALDELKTSFGLGLRYKIDQEAGLNVRFDFGIGGNGANGFYVQAQEAF